MSYGEKNPPKKGLGLKNLFNKRKKVKKIELAAKPSPKSIKGPKSKRQTIKRPGDKVDVLGMATKSKAGIDAYVARMMKSEGLTKAQAIAKFKKSKGMK